MNSSQWQVVPFHEAPLPTVMSRHMLVTGAATVPSSAHSISKTLDNPLWVGHFHPGWLRESAGTPFAYFQNPLRKAHYHCLVMPLRSSTLTEACYRRCTTSNILLQDFCNAQGVRDSCLVVAEYRSVGRFSGPGFRFRALMSFIAGPWSCSAVSGIAFTTLHRLITVSGWLVAGSRRPLRSATGTFITVFQRIPHVDVWARSSHLQSPLITTAHSTKCTHFSAFRILIQTIRTSRKSRKISAPKTRLLVPAPPTQCPLLQSHSHFTSHQIASQYFKLFAGQFSRHGLVLDEAEVEESGHSACLEDGAEESTFDCLVRTERDEVADFHHLQTAETFEPWYQRKVLEGWFLAWTDWEWPFADNDTIGLIFIVELPFGRWDRVVRSVEECGPDWPFGVVDFGKDYSLFWSSNLFYNTKNYWFYSSWPY